MEDYVFRAEHLDDIWYRALIGNKKNPVYFLPGHPEFEESCLVHCVYPRVPVLAGLSVPKASEKNVFSALLLILLKPFRLDSILALNPRDDWDESFQEWEAMCSPEIQQYIEQFRQLGEGRDLLESERTEHIAELREEQAVPDEMIEKVIAEDDEVENLDGAEDGVEAKDGDEDGDEEDLEELDEIVDKKEDQFAIAFEAELMSNAEFMGTKFDIVEGDGRDFCSWNPNSKDVLAQSQANLKRDVEEARKRLWGLDVKVPTGPVSGGNNRDKWLNRAVLIADDLNLNPAQRFAFMCS